MPDFVPIDDLSEDRLQNALMLWAFLRPTFRTDRPAWWYFSSNHVQHQAMLDLRNAGFINVRESDELEGLHVATPARKAAA